MDVPLSGRPIRPWSPVPRQLLFSKPVHQVGSSTSCTVHGARQVETLEEVEELVVLGGRNRTVGNNNVNEHSSRSHLVLQVHITSTDVASGYVQHGKLNLIDLAGSERIKVRLCCLVYHGLILATIRTILRERNQNPFMPTFVCTLQWNPLAN